MLEWKHILDDTPTGQHCSRLEGKVLTAGAKKSSGQERSFFACLPCKCLSSQKQFTASGGCRSESGMFVNVLPQAALVQLQFSIRCIGRISP